MPAMIEAGVLAMPAVLARNVGPTSIFSFIISICVILSIGLTMGSVIETIDLSYNDLESWFEGDSVWNSFIENLKHFRTKITIDGDLAKYPYEAAIWPCKWNYCKLKLVKINLKGNNLSDMQQSILRSCLNNFVSLEF